MTCYGRNRKNMCLLTTSPAPCDHVECKTPGCCLTPLPHFPQPTASSALFMGLMQLNQLLLGMASQSTKAQTYLEAIATHLTTYRKGSICDMEFRYPDDRSYRGRLSLIGDEIKQVFKERGFPLALQILGSDGSPRKTSGLRCKVCLYSQETPPKRILQNISGKKILRGTIEAESDTEGLVKFPNIVINEVSSHYINDAFYLVVMPASPDIKPFTAESFSVRARKPMKRCSRNYDLQEWEA